MRDAHHDAATRKIRAMLQYSQQKQSSSNVHTRRQQYLCCLDVPALPLLLQNAAADGLAAGASERLLMVAGNTSNVHAEQCVARASFDDDGATAGGRPQRALRVGGRSCTAKGTCSVIIAATGAARPFKGCPTPCTSAAISTSALDITTDPLILYPCTCKLLVMINIK